MKQAIISFDIDDEGHWRALLVCGHHQHVRHRPPLESRPWVLEEGERLKRIGIELECLKCEDEAGAAAN